MDWKMCGRLYVCWAVQFSRKLLWWSWLKGSRPVAPGGGRLVDNSRRGGIHRILRVKDRSACGCCGCFSCCGSADCCSSAGGSAAAGAMRETWNCQPAAGRRRQAAAVSGGGCRARRLLNRARDERTCEPKCTPWKAAREEAGGTRSPELHSRKAPIGVLPLAAVNPAVHATPRGTAVTAGWLSRARRRLLVIARGPLAYWRS